MSDLPDATIAYFSMEIGVAPSVPTYSGGLGVLAGDTIQSAADMKLPMVAVTLLHRQGYFYQRLDESGWQTEEPVQWSQDDYLQELAARVTVTIEGRPVHLRAWRYDVRGVTGAVVPVIFLDSDLGENADWDRTLTHWLYGGDSFYRLCQEVVLGIGGVRMLRALGYDGLERFHMNEGHASLLTLELLHERSADRADRHITDEDIEAVRERCVFTTHTPVAAGHDRFDLDVVKRVLGAAYPAWERSDAFCCDNSLNMTYLALSLSHYVNGVAKKHGEVSQHMFTSYVIDSITNGVHAARWTSPPLQKLFDEHIPGWREDNFSLRYALSLERPVVWAAHLENKRQLTNYVNRETNAGFDADVLTLGFARRATSYKRADLLFEDEGRLRRMAQEVGGLQIVYAGKAHPLDKEGKRLIQRIFQARQRLKDDVKISYLANYDMEAAQLLVAGVDVWLNTPEPPMEASGTSGMKAALNGVPSLSILDGWWIEGCIENTTGWAIGGAHHHHHDRDKGRDRAADAVALYDKLEQVVMPLFYQRREAFIGVMMHAIALNGSFFNTQRMMQQYVLKAYFG